MIQKKKKKTKAIDSIIKVITKSCIEIKTYSIKRVNPSYFSKSHHSFSESEVFGQWLISKMDIEYLKIDWKVGG